MSSSTFFNGCKIQLLLAVALFASQGSAYLFQPVVISCMYWDLLSTHHKNDEPYKIHCIQDENGLPGIVNTTWKLVQAGYCPYFDRHGKSISIRPCDSSTGTCPEDTIFSYEVVSYAGCYGSIPQPTHVMTTEPVLPNTSQSQCECPYTEGFIGVIAIVSASLILIAAALTLLFRMYKGLSKKSRPCNRHHGCKASLDRRTTSSISRFNNPDLSIDSSLEVNTMERNESHSSSTKHSSESRQSESTVMGKPLLQVQ